MIQIFVTGGSLVSPRLENAEFSGNVFSARVDSLAGRTYFLEFNPSLTAGDWRLVGQFPGDGTRLTLSDLNATNTSGFYRARVQ